MPLWIPGLNRMRSPSSAASAASFTLLKLLLLHPACLSSVRTRLQIYTAPFCWTCHSLRTLSDCYPALFSAWIQAGPYTANTGISRLRWDICNVMLHTILRALTTAGTALLSWSLASFTCAELFHLSQVCPHMLIALAKSQYLILNDRHTHALQNLLQQTCRMQ